MQFQCACGDADQGEALRLQRVFLNSTGRRPQAESGQRRRRDNYDLRILAGLRWLSMLGQLRPTGDQAENCRVYAQVTRIDVASSRRQTQLNYCTGNRG